MDKSLIETWRMMIRNFYDAVRNNIDEELYLENSYCETSLIREYVDFIDNLNTLSDTIDEYEEGTITNEDLTKLTKFIKEDIGDIDEFRKRLEDMSEYEDIDNIKENIDSIVSVVFGWRKPFLSGDNYYRLCDLGHSHNFDLKNER